MNCAKSVLIIGALLTAFVAVYAGTPQPLPIQKMDVPAWIAKDTKLDGNITLSSNPGLGKVRCDYSVDGKTESVECRADAVGTTHSFSIPPLKDAKSSSLALTIRAQSSNGVVAYESKPHVVALADVTELDITGAAAEVLKFPLKPFGLDAQFIPCCNISGGVTRVERIPVNPGPNIDGLPKRLVSPFLRATPCPLSKASAGLSLDLTIDVSLSPKPVPGNVKAYRWHEHSWKPVFNTTLDEQRGAISFHVPDGGTFVLGEESAGQ